MRIIWLPIFIKLRNIKIELLVCNSYASNCSFFWSIDTQSYECFTLNSILVSTHLSILRKLNMKVKWYWWKCFQCTVNHCLLREPCFSIFPASHINSNEDSNVHFWKTKEPKRKREVGTWGDQESGQFSIWEQFCFRHLYLFRWFIVKAVCCIIDRFLYTPHLPTSPKINAWDQSITSINQIFNEFTKSWGVLKCWRHGFIEKFVSTFYCTTVLDFVTCHLYKEETPTL